MKNLTKVGFVQAPDANLRKQVLSGFRLLRKKSAVVGEPTASISAKKVAIGDDYSSERTMTGVNVQNIELLLSTTELLDPLIMALHIMAALGEIRYESHDLEVQFQLQLISSTKVANKIEELRKRLEDAEVELRTSRSLTDKLKEQLVESSNTVSVQDSKITFLEAAKVIANEEKKGKILKFERKLAYDGYNLCLKKMSKAYLEVDTEVLDYIEVFDIMSEEFEDDEDPEDPNCSCCFLAIFLIISFCNISFVMIPDVAIRTS
ncbi:hypothetical protein F0562_012714 [Nyssa sinensis]|uniref:Uncharacterized protein n=1 Tax=Nyssa sinensis TaxID=561372 RepID=A0A5J4ZX33_9ASTE|nr:hypothetical protein F0562_012714 [Nyssa sinensis]